MKGYGEYKKTTYDWLPSIPAYWDQTTIRSLMQLSDMRCGTRLDLELLSVYREYGVIKKDSRDDNYNKASLDISNYKYVGKNFVVMNKMKMWQGSLGVSAFEGIVSPAYIVCTVRKDLNFRYLNYLLRSHPFKIFYNRISYGIRVGQWDLRYDDLKTLRLFLPPREEQNQIVRYLDAKVGKINKLIRIKQKQIALLKEKKQAIINQAVTKGLDSSVSMKDSGVAWIGQIPEGWEVIKFKHLISQIDQGVSPQAEARLASSGEWGVLKAGCVNYGVFREAEHKALPRGYFIDETLSVRIGDMLISRACGSAHLVGSVGIVDSLKYKLLLCDKIFRPIFKENKIKLFCYYAMNSSYFKNQIKESISGAEGLANNLPLAKLKDFVIAIPSVSLCFEISNYLSERFFNIDSLREQLLQEISTLTEYRTRLISDVVTGKVDVRGALVDEELSEDLENITDAHQWLAQNDEDVYPVDEDTLAE